ALQPGHTYRVQILTHDGDQNKSGGDAGEFCVKLKIPGPPPLSTKSSPSSGTVGDTITDKATLSGTPVPTGSVTFKLYNDASCTNLVFSDTETLSGGQATSAGFKTTAPGTYYWVDTYSGDSICSAPGPFPGAPGSSACSSDPLEQSTVSPPPPPGIQVVKLDSVPCADLSQKVAQPPDVTCVNGHTTFTRGIITVELPESGNYSIPISYEIRVTNTGQTPLVLAPDDPMCD